MPGQGSCQAISFERLQPLLGGESESNPIGVDHHEGHEVHEERKLTTKGAKSFQSEISETFVSFVIFVVRRLFLEYYPHD
jgi:hypothetical protein